MMEDLSMKDPLIDEIRRVRHQISEEVGHDPARLIQYYMNLQERHKDRLVVLSHRGKNYTEERRELFKDITLEQAIDEKQKLMPPGEGVGGG